MVGDAPALRRLEAIVHPLVRNAEAKFLQDAERAGAAVVVLDIPLLFETGGEARVDATVVVSAPGEMQRSRALERGLSLEQLEALLTRQMPDAEKRRRADFVVDSGQGIEHARAQVRHILAAVGRMPARRKVIRSKATMREIVFDTETTGLDPLQGDRMVEIGCIELINRFPSGRTFHCYFNPERDMPEPAFKVHGLSVEFLKDKPLFAHKVDELIEFLGDAPLVAHNAMFDLGFLNAELERAKKTAGGARAAGRYADAGAAQASRRLEPARRSLPALQDRQLEAHQAWRAARRRAAGRDLCRADRRAADQPRPRRRIDPGRRRAHARS